ncbi:hypothetical protein [Thalassobellus citreus]|uniref:hypothetical protein n=1 Tax=Thalassobellus citreus TaxID=3367752 RepID=UPI003799AA54
MSAQSEFFKKEYFEVYDSIDLYQNNNVFNGLEYIDNYISLSVENHKFYGSSDFLKGYIIYNDLPHFNVKMKYDLLNDLVILEFVNIKVTNLSLNSSLVSQFVLNNAQFVRLPQIEILRPFYVNGFFQVAYNGPNYTLYVKYKKSKIEKLRNKKVYYTFKSNEVYVLFYKNKYLKINSKKNIIEAIPERETEISNYYKFNKRLYKKSKHQFFVKLFTSLK